MHKEHSEHQGRFAHDNDDEGHEADAGDPDATEVPEVDLKYAGSSDNDCDYETAANPAVVATEAVKNAAAAKRAAAQAVHTIQAAQHAAQAPFLEAYLSGAAEHDLNRCRDFSRKGNKKGELCRPKPGAALTRALCHRPRAIIFGSLSFAGRLSVILV
jgi:hypothetical protein